jgi:Ca-activated chloride channel family protein
MLPDMSAMPVDFLRPLWLLCLIVVFLFSLLRYKNHTKGEQQTLIAPHLSANIVSKAGHSMKHFWAFNSLAVIACIALAGPTWRSIEMPVYEMEKAQIIVFDLSYSMFATDIKPNRLSQAKFKAIDLIKQWSEGEKAMIAYAGDAFTVAPLTRDGNAIINHIPHLSPDIMPVRGSRADLALKKAIELLKNAGYTQGHIVFISDDITEQQSQEMQETLKGEDWIVSILAVATEQGAPITLPNGSLLKSDRGEIIVPKLSGQPLYDIAQASNGLYLTSRNDSSDINQLGSYYDNIKQTRKSESEQAASDQFSIDDGYWLSFLLLPLFLLLFRKGVFFALLLAIYLPLSSPPLEAAENALVEKAEDSIWKNNQQNAYDAYKNEDYQRASELYETPLEQANALYKNKQYDQALEQFAQAIKQQPKNADAFYNQGNNFAQRQQLDKAIEAYDNALAIDPAMKQAAENKGVIKQLQEQQKEQDKQQQDKNKKQDKQQKNDDQNQQDSEENEQNKQDQKDSEQDKNQEQQDSEQDKQQESKKQSEQDKKQAEQQSQNEKEQQAQEEKKEKEQQQKQQQAEQDKQQQENKQDAQPAQPLSESDEESNQELEALPNWLKNMPDDPSILLRRKMQIEYQKRNQSQPVKQKTNNGVIW